jgi:beta-N-acetylhexosaminidase
MADLRHLKRRIGQRLIVGFDGPRVPPELQRLDEEWGLGGYILFKRNLETLDQIMDLTEELWDLGQGVPPFIGIDEEGGKVHRLPEPFTVFAEMAQLGTVNSVSVAYEVGAVVGRELTAAGFNLNFAPVMDINTNPDNPVIGKRAISEDPEVVAALSKAVVRGLHDNAIIACGKHFPGHGDTHQDSHFTLPVCDIDMERMRQIELKPYAGLTQGSPMLDMIMTAHVLYPKLDPHHPATLSRTILQDILRLELGFKGLIISDDLEMKAIVDHYGMADAARLALEAGVDSLHGLPLHRQAGRGARSPAARGRARLLPAPPVGARLRPRARREGPPLPGGAHRRPRARPRAHRQPRAPAHLAAPQGREVVQPPGFASDLLRDLVARRRCRAPLAVGAVGQPRLPQPIGPDRVAGAGRAGGDIPDHDAALLLGGQPAAVG